MSSAGLARLERRLATRSAEGLRRRRRVLASPQGPHVVVDGTPMLSFASNDYLGLANDPRVVEALAAGARACGAGAGASHLVCGHHSAHEALELALAEFVRPCSGARAITLSSGYLANLAILATLADRDSEIFADKLNHACLNDGALLSRARLIRYPHLDLAALRARLAASRAPTRIIATDAVFSMDGDCAPLDDLLALADAYDAWLVVDDAHGFGIRGEGRGSLAASGIAAERIVYMGTLGKAAGVAGAFVAAHPLVIEGIVQGARPYIYTTAAPAALAEALLQSLAIIRDEPGRRVALAARIGEFREAAAGHGLAILPSHTPIQPLVVGATRDALDLEARLARAGLLVPAIRPPTVPAGAARLRISLSAAHSAADVDRLVATLAA